MTLKLFCFGKHGSASVIKTEIYRQESNILLQKVKIELSVPIARSPYKCYTLYSVISQGWLKTNLSLPTINAKHLYLVKRISEEKIGRARIVAASKLERWLYAYYVCN